MNSTTRPAQTVGQVRQRPVESLTVPTLDEVAARPDIISELSSGVVSTLILKCAAAQTALAARLLVCQAGQRPASEEPATETRDRVVSVREAAQLLNTSRASLYEKWRRLPFAFKDPLDGRLKFRARGIEQYIAARSNGRPS